MNKDLISYYAKRAAEYERIYQKPERQSELEKLKKYLQKEFTDKNVFEAACGTGYWTQFIAETANTIYATDINEEVLDIARLKKTNNKNVFFAKEDIFNAAKENKYNSLFGGFIWSHIPAAKLKNFLNAVESRVEEGAKIIFVDNNFAEGSSTPIASRDEEGNTYQLRKLEDGTEHLVLKNFPDARFMHEFFNTMEITIEFQSWEYFWILKYRKKLFHLRYDAFFF